MNAAKLTKKYMMLIVLILLIVFFSIFGENFLSVENAITVCRQVSIIGICATGMMFALLTAHIDLSIGATVSFAAVFWAKLISTNAGYHDEPVSGDARCSVLLRHHRHGQRPACRQDQHAGSDCDHGDVHGPRGRQLPHHRRKADLQDRRVHLLDRPELRRARSRCPLSSSA